MIIHPRSDWTSQGPKGATPLNPAEVRYIAIHWPGSSSPTIDPAKAAAYLKGWQQFHVDGRGWRDIAYNEAVDQNGDVWILRGDNADGSVSGMGGRVYSILAIIGNAEEPSGAMKASIVARVGRARARYTRAAVRGHRELVSTTCPGPKVFAWIEAGMPVPLDPPLDPPPVSDPPPVVDPSLPDPATPALPAKLKVDGELGPLTYRAVQWLAGAPSTGRFDELTVRGLQRFLGVRDDGVFGPLSTKRLQWAVDETQDGEWGSATTKGLQRMLNAFLAGARNAAAPVDGPVEFWAGSANMHDPRFGGPTDYDAKSLAVHRLLDASLLTVSETNRATRRALAVGSYWYLVAPGGSVAAYFDTAQWIPDLSRVDDVSFRPSRYHGAIRVPVRNVANGAELELIATHSRPSALTDAAGKKADVRAAAGLRSSGSLAVLGGDFNIDPDGVLPAWRRITPDVDTMKHTGGSQRFDALLTVGIPGAGGKVLDPRGLSDHEWVRARGTLAKKGSTS